MVLLLDCYGSLKYDNCVVLLRIRNSFNDDFKVRLRLERNQGIAQDLNLDSCHVMSAGKCSIFQRSIKSSSLMRHCMGRVR